MIRNRNISGQRPVRGAATFALATIMACSLSFPPIAFATVAIDDAELNQGKNAVGGGTATLADSSLDMKNVTAGQLSTDEDLTVNFNGGNKLEGVIATGSAEVELNYEGDNEVEDVVACDNADVTVNATGNNEFEELVATADSNMTINVTGENDIENVGAMGNANITVRGTDCQKKDVVNLGEEQTSTFIRAENGELTVDHATVNVKGEAAFIGSDNGDVHIDTSKIAGDDENKYTEIDAGGTMNLKESVVEIAGTVHSRDEMTIEHSDLSVHEPEVEYGDPSPYRVYSETGIELIDEENGEVEEGEMHGKTVHYVDTDDNDGKIVNLEADGEPAYYNCKDDSSTHEAPVQMMAAPRTGDRVSPLLPMAAGIASAVTAAYAARKREER